MQHKTPAYIAVLFSAIALAISCSKPTPFGAALLDDQIADYAYTDTLTLKCTVQLEDSVLSSDRSSTASYFTCGTLNDPDFGKTEASAYALFQLSTVNPDFSTVSFDSVVLYLKMNPDGFYGDSTQAENIYVHRLTEQLDWDGDYYSSQSLAVGTELGRLENFYPKPNTKANQWDTTSTATKASYISIPLSPAFGQELLGLDSLTRTDDTLFWKTVGGLRISASSSGDKGAIMAFSLNDPNFSFIRLYYTRDTTHYSYDCVFVGCNKFNQFKHDYGTSPAAQAIGVDAAQRLFLQGMGGLRIKMEIPYVDQLKNIIVNKAELELTSAVPSNEPVFGSANQLIFTERRGDTTFIFTSDVTYSLGTTLTGGFTNFGGYPVNETDSITNQMVKRYRLTLSDRLQNMADDTSGDIKNKTLYINVYTQRYSPMRSIFYGPGSTEYPAKISLKYTKIQ